MYEKNYCEFFSLQRANRMGIATPKKETANKTWSDEDLESALEALRRREISANKAAKIYKIPSSVSKIHFQLMYIEKYDKYNHRKLSHCIII